MGNKYWLDRNSSAMAMARGAATSEARLIHYELAGRYSIMAAQCLPFAPPGGQSAVRSERPVLRLADAAPPRTVREPSARGDPVDGSETNLDKGEPR